MEVKETDKRSQILDTALKLFVDKGLQQTSMAEISKVSGVAVGTMYHHFKGKDELINALFLKIKENLGDAVAFTETQSTLPFKERFEILWQNAYNFYINNPEQFIFQDNHSYSPIISQKTRELARESYQGAIKFIVEAVQKDIFIKTDIGVLMRWYYNSVRTLVEVKLANEIPVDADMVKSTIEMTWRSISIKDK